MILWTIRISFIWGSLVDLLATSSVVIIFFEGSLLMKVFNREHERRKIHNKQKKLSISNANLDETLNNLIPPNVLEKIKRGEKEIVNKLNEVTLLFSDIVGFTDFCRQARPKQVVQLLSDLFTRFDKLCQEKDVYKVHTIGDCYVLMGYTGYDSIYNRTDEVVIAEANKVVETGMEMIKIIQQVARESEDELIQKIDMRIGIHTGDIIAGIIGTKVVRYDIFGQNVLIANKMEANGEKGHVVVSEKTKEVLETDEELRN